eukprot:4254857-Ditylum_brightwellii.AAC.1
MAAILLWVGGNGSAADADNCDDGGVEKEPFSSCCRIGNCSCHGWWWEYGVSFVVVQEKKRDN